jgi:hypothetical protein
MQRRGLTGDAARAAEAFLARGLSLGDLYASAWWWRRPLPLGRRGSPRRRHLLRPTPASEARRRYLSDVLQLALLWGGTFVSAFYLLDRAGLGSSPRFPKSAPLPSSWQLLRGSVLPVAHAWGSSSICRTTAAIRARPSASDGERAPCAPRPPAQRPSPFSAGFDLPCPRSLPAAFVSTDSAFASPCRDAL